MLMSFYLLTRYFVENFSVFFVKKIVLAIIQSFLTIKIARSKYGSGVIYFQILKSLAF